MPLKKAPLIILALLAFFMASTAVVVKVKGQVGWSTTEIYNKVFDAANNRLMTTPWAGAQAGQYLSDTEILNKVFDSANNLLRTSGGTGGPGSSAFNDLTSGTNTTATMTVGSGATITPTGTGIIRATTLTDGDKGDVTSTAGVITIDNQVITYNKLQNETASTLLGRGSSGPGAPQELTLGTNLSISGTTLNATGGGSALILDLGNNGSNEYTALSKLATTGDTNSIFTEPLPDVFLIDVSKKWPVAVLADTATVATSATSATSATTATNITDADKGDISITGGVWNVDPNTITYAKMQDVSAASRLLGRGSAVGAGDPEEITLGGNCTMTGTVLNCTGGATIADGDKGDITTSGSGATWTIDPGVVTYSKMQNVSATARILGRNTAGAGSMEELSPATVKSMLGITFGDIGSVATDAQIPDLNTLSTGLAVLQCVTTDGAGKLASTGSACGSSGGTVNISGTPVVDQIAVWTNANTIKGSSSLSVNLTDLDAGSATRTRPNLVNTTAPATCAVGDTYFDSDAPAGRNIYGCTAINTWTLEGDGGSGGVTDGDKGDITVSSSGTVWTLDNTTVTYAKIQNVSATARLLGRTSAGAGSIEELTAAAAKTLLSITFADIGNTATDAQIPDLNTLSTGLTASRCVETDGTGKLSVTAAACSTGSSIAPTIITLSAATGTPTAVAVGTAGANIIAERFDISGTLTLIAPTGTPANGQSLLFRLKPASTPQTLSFTSAAGAFCAAAGLVLPTSTGDSTTYVEYGFHYNAGVTSPGACWVYDGGTKATAPLDVASGGLGIASGTSGGIPAFTAAGTIASSGALTANQPVIGGGAGAVPTVGSRSGNTTSFATTTGTLTSTTCAQWDASGNLTSTGSACGSGGGITASSTDTLTNKTLDAEATGNILTLPSHIALVAAGCQGTTAASFWDLPTTTPAVAACVTGTNIQKGVLDFADTTGGFSAQNSLPLPAAWTTTNGVDVALYWTTTAVTGNAKWTVQFVCTDVAATATDDPAFPGSGAGFNTVTTAAPGTASRVQTSTITGATLPASCVTSTAALLHIRLFRDGNDAADTIAATARLLAMQLTVRRRL